MSADRKYFIRTLAKWVDDDSPLKILEKGRQVGGSDATDYRTVCLVSEPGARFDAFISTRDTVQAKLSIQNCHHWARFLHLGARDLGEIVLDRETDTSAFALEFANGRRIYALSSNPNALAGKCGHVILDEFALHKDQRLLYRIAKPVTTWGGSLTILSTHRGVNTVFHHIIRDILDRGNPMGWKHYKLTLQQAVNEGLVERINKKSGRNESRHAFLKRIRAECLDEEQWLQEYCCIPADENSAFITHEMISACEDSALKLQSVQEFIAGLQDSRITHHASRTFYIGVDVARKIDLCVIDVGEKIGDVMYDRLRVELLDQPFSEIRRNLYPLLELPQVQRCCIDNSGNGIETTEEAQKRFGPKVEAVNFSIQVKERLAFPLRHQFEDLALRIPVDDKLRADLHAIKKETTAAGNVRFIGDTDDSHCDRFWAKALRQEAARTREEEPWIMVG
jgi:phage FluMu gp28-like protein